MRAEIRGRIEKFKNGEVPEGYKKTRRRTIPIDWEIKSLNELVERISKPVEVDPDVHYKQIGIRSHGKGIFYKDEVTGYELGKKAVFWIEPDCFIVNIVFAWEMAVARTTSAEAGMIASHRFPMYRPIRNKINVDYLTYFFKSAFGKSLLELASPGGAGRNKTLGQKEFMALTLPVPKAISEQQKIATILSTWDKAIELKERLIEHKKEQKRGLMQALLSGRVRLPGFKEDWKEVELRDVVSNFIVPMRDKPKIFDGDIPWCRIEDFSGKYLLDSKTYQRVNMETVNNMNLKVLPIDTVLVSCSANLGECAIVKKPLVTNQTFIGLVTNDKIDVELLYYLMTFNKCKLNILSSGTTISYLSREEFEKFKILVPFDLLEQKRISNLLSIKDKEIDLLAEELSALKLQKKGLMQLLLTGVVRVQN